jgi:Zn-dependent protease
MLGNSAPTPYDLRFSLLGIPVRVHPFFWLFSAVMGWNADDPNRTLLWIACVFVSILVHEFGHALTANSFGWPPEVVLYTFGGYASFHPGSGYTRARSVLILLAGPGAGFVLYGLLQGLTWILLQQGTLPDDPRFLVRDPAISPGLRYLSFVLLQMEFINLWWGLVNLLPVFPLDGGQIARNVMTGLWPRDGLEKSLKLSLVVGGGVALYFFMDDETYAGILFAALAVESLQYLQGMRYR